MKLIILSIILFVSASASTIDINGYQNSMIYCNEKSNLLFKKIWTSKYTIEELYCLDKSSWDSSCLVLVKCNGEIIKVKEQK